MKQAQEIYFHEFDQALFDLPAIIRRQIVGKIRELGSRLETFADKQ